MTALADSKHAPPQEVGLPSYPVKASTTIYKGSIVCVESSSGYAVPGSDTSGLIVVGIADREVVNGTTNGEKWVTVRRGRFRLAADSGAITQVGANVCVKDSATVAPASVTTNDIAIGPVVRYISATELVVQVGSGEDI